MLQQLLYFARCQQTGSLRNKSKFFCRPDGVFAKGKNGKRREMFSILQNK
jgi:hypothetical protein